MKTSTIGWTDYSGGNLNFVTGCTPVSEGCKNCYARAIYDRFGRDFTPTVHPEKLEKLLTMRFPEFSPKRGAPHRPMCFVCDTGDLFHEDVPEQFILDALEIMEAYDGVVWQVLTKRAERMRDMVKLYLDCVDEEPILGRNIWLGVTAENQRTANERIPLLVNTPAAVRFVSVEPMLEAVDLDTLLVKCPICTPSHYELATRYLDWVICGAESGRTRRLFDVTWAVGLYEQCKAARLPYFFKQGSGLKPGMNAVLPGSGEVKQWP